MIRVFPALAFVLAALAVACSSGEGDDDPTTAAVTSENASPTAAPAADCTPARPHDPGASRASLASGGSERQYILSVPDSYAGVAQVPLVIALHAFGGTAQSMSDLTGITDAAGKRGWIVALPEATGSPQSWNAEGFTAGTDDSGFLRDLIAELSSSLCIDTGRIFATGYSNGGAMALRAACDLAGTFGAVAPVAAPYPTCQADVPIIAFHGSQDATVPYEGGIGPDGTNYAPVHKSVSSWARAIGCDGLPVISRAAADVEISTYARCPLGDSEALLYSVLNGGHTWPGAAVDYPVADAGVTSHAISATELMLDFFEAHPRP
jgi:polyhydroxybutyrate depolymerase